MGTGVGCGAEGENKISLFGKSFWAHRSCALGLFLEPEGDAGLVGELAPLRKMFRKNIHPARKPHPVSAPAEADNMSPDVWAMTCSWKL